MGRHTGTWRVRGRDITGEDTYLTITSSDDQVLVYLPPAQGRRLARPRELAHQAARPLHNAVLLAPRKAQQLRQVVGLAIADVLWGQTW